MEIMDRMRDPELLAAMGIGDKLLGSLIVMVLGMATCMVVLYLIMLMIKLLRLSASGSSAKAAMPVSPAPLSAARVPAEDDGEAVAAIVAAVTQMQGGKPFYIRNIALASDRESWSSAGILEAFDSRKAEK